jgi:plasmid stabilization system protein ParE
MAKKIIWSPEALADLRSIHDYIAHDSEAIASNFIERLLNDVDRLAEFLLIGARIREFKRSDYRHLIVRPYPRHLSRRRRCRIPHRSGAWCA